MNNNEYEVPYQLDREGEILTITAEPQSDSGTTYPDLCYHIKVDGSSMTVEDEGDWRRMSSLAVHRFVSCPYQRHLIGR